MIRALGAIAVALLGAASAADAAEQSSGGLPQLNAGDFAPQLIWLAISFVVLLIIMSRVALPRIGEVLEERRDRVTRDLTAAGRLKGEAEAAMAAYEKALADARGSASAFAREKREQLAAQMEKERAELDRVLAARMSEAEASIAATKSKALANVNEIAAGTASAIIDKLIGQSVSPDEVTRALGRNPGSVS